MAAKLRMAVVGLGRAGRARVAALADHPRAELAAVVRREPGPAERHLYEVVEDPSIDAVIVCTPNRLHAAAAGACLEAGKHVAVEFPLAGGTGEARKLLGLAARAGRILHEEHIELLSPSQRFQRERARALGRPTGGELRFGGGLDGWIGDAALAGTPALRALARLHRLIDLFGEAVASGARVGMLQPAGYRLTVELDFRAGGRARLVEERAPASGRSTRWALACERGWLRDPPDEPPGALFRIDLDRFIDRIEQRAACYVSDERVLHALELVERIEALCAKTSGDGSAR